MYCTNCGKEIDANAAVCMGCGVTVGTQKKFCANCGKAVTPEQAICVGCGCSLSNVKITNNQVNSGGKTVSAGGKSATTAMIMSCLIPGLGQMYLGQTTKGVVLLILALVIDFVTFGFGAILPALIAMFDAYKIGKKLESGQSVGEWEFF